MRGAFISLEGGEGVGKSTNLAFVAAAVRAAGFDAVVTREPGGTVLGERIREWMLHGEHGPLSADVETLLMFAARAQHLAELIRPALARGQWVICDRFTDATVAYQGGGRGVTHSMIAHLRADVQGGLEPDLTLLLDAPLEVAAGRITTRKPDHFEREQQPFFMRVRAAYLKLAAQEPDRIKVIDAARALEEVQRSIAAQLANFIATFNAR